MSFIKYLLRCIDDFIDICNPPSTAFFKEAVIGFIVIAIIISSFVVSWVFINWYVALMIVVGGIIVFCMLSIIIELVIKKIKE